MDVHFQTGAVGPAASKRARPYGCVYTAPMVKRLLDDGRRLLLVHYAPEALFPHPALKVITTVELRARARAASGEARAARIAFDNAAQAFWGEVSLFFEAELGVRMPDIAALETRVASHRQQLAWHRAFLWDLSPNAFICMAHYFRAPQIEAARRLKIHTIDYQHGINSRYHLGYGYPNLKPEARLISYFPVEFWSWGEIWTNRKWFANACCAVRHTDHAAHAHVTRATHFDERSEKSVPIAFSWAMQSVFRESISKIASTQPEWTVRVKLHPREHVAQYAVVTATYPNVEVLPGDVDVVEAARKVRYVLSICSSSLFDVLVAHCRIGASGRHRWNTPRISPPGAGCL